LMRSLSITQYSAGFACVKEQAGRSPGSDRLRRGARAEILATAVADIRDFTEMAA